MNISLDSNIKFIVNSMAIYPNENGRFSVMRFITPKDRNYVLDVIFTHIENCALHSGVYIIYNNVTLWEIDLTAPKIQNRSKQLIVGFL